MEGMIKKFFSSYILNLAVATGVLLLLQFAPTLFVSNNNSINVFNTTLNKKEKLATETLSQLKKTNVTDSLFTTFKKLTYELNYQGVSFFVINKNKPIFWSDRNISFTNNLREFSSKNGIVRLQNGWYQYVLEKEKENAYLALILIKHQYSIENQSLKNNFHKSFSLSKDVQLLINQKESENTIYSIDGESLFSLGINGDSSVLGQTNWLIIIVFLLMFLQFISFGSKVLRTAIGRKYHPLLMICFVIFFKTILSIFQFPNIVFQQEIFNPSIYASSTFLSSLGEFFLTILSFVIVVYYIIRGINIIKVNRSYFAPIYLILTASFSLVFGSWIEDLVMNSILSFDVNSFLELNTYSFIGILSITLLLIALVLLFSRMYLYLINVLGAGKAFVYFLLLNTISIVCGYYLLEINLYLSLWSILVALSIHLQKNTKSRLLHGTVFVFVMALTVAYGFEYYGNIKHKSDQAFLVKKLAKEQDYITEFLFKDVETKLIKDTYIKEQITTYWDAKKEIDSYIKKKYFNGFWNRYDVNILACNKTDSIYVEAEKKEALCYDFFVQKIEKQSVRSIENKQSLVFLYADDGIGSYLAQLNVSGDIEENAHYLFIELTPKTFSKSEGYPELLLDNSEIDRSINLENISFAKYKKNTLVNSSGDFNYRLELPQSIQLAKEEIVYFEEHEHTIYRTGRSVVLLSSPIKTAFNYITTLSYFFILVGFLVLFLGFFFRLEPFQWEIAFTDFSTKIQLFVIVSIFLSFIMFGWGTSYYIKEQYQQKNNKQVTEKVQSVLIELEHKLGGKSRLNSTLYEEMTYYLVKFSNVFYTDINLYDLNGKLLASSRPEIFERSLISSRMDAEAYQQIILNKKSAFIHAENIGELSYLSAYVPFRNENNKILAYLNLPYFAKQNELENELSLFFTALINIYALLFLISAIIAVFFANYISEPVRMIKNRLKDLQLGKSSELIEWKSNDEIGSLVTEYNKKVLELEKSAILLAKSERETAWREMAKQVAHEIKNPLTPMKLSIQHLQRVSEDNPVDLNERINRTAKTLIQQIDTLSNIATEFSNFAQMPKANNSNVNISAILETTIDLFKEEKVSISLIDTTDKGVSVIADQDQLSRVFNNLIKNAIQAIPENRAGEIYIELVNQKQHVLILVKDNGTGITSDKIDKIFVPNFTTKTTGMGLGLAMVKNIVENANGKIWFDSIEDNGTTFFVQLPTVE